MLEGEGTPNGDGGSGGEGGEAAGTPPAAPVKPEGLADSYFDAEKGVNWEALTGDLTKGSEALQREAAAKEGVPQSPDGYVFNLPKDLDLPEGATIDPKNPLAQLIAKVAHEDGRPQAFVDRVIQEYATGEAARLKEVQTARDAEIAKLGDKGLDRIKAVSNFLEQTFGSEEGDDLGSAMLSLLTTAKSVERIEAVAKKFGMPITAKGQPGAKDEPKNGRDMLKAAMNVDQES